MENESYHCRLKGGLEHINQMKCLTSLSEQIEKTFTRQSRTPDYELK